MVKVTVCQAESLHNADANLQKIRKIMYSAKGGIFLFPEMFLTGYGSEIPDDAVLENAVKELQSLCREHDSAVAMGMPLRRNGRICNTLVFITSEKTQTYEKMHLANFGKYDESMFALGDRPVMVEWKGMKFGLIICYDIFFPELSRYYAVNGADAILMASASAEQSERVMKTMLPARALENTVYMVFCNNIGEFNDTRFFGGSSVYLPTGETAAGAASKEEVLTVDIDPDVIRSAREKRPHLRDRRADIFKIRGRTQPNLFM